MAFLPASPISAPFFSFPSVTLLCVLLLVSYIGRIIYVAYLGPLSKIPGPSIARFSNIWRIKTAASGNAPRTYQDLHRKYGTVVRTGPHNVSVSDPAQISTIYGISSKFTKSSFYNVFIPMIDGKTYNSIFSLQSHSTHRALKSTIAQKYSLSSLLTLEPLVDTVTRSFMATLHSIEQEHALQNQYRNSFEKLIPSTQGTQLDLGTWLQYYAFDVIGAITFSRTFNFISTGIDSRGVLKGLEGGLRYGVIVGQVPWLHCWLLGNKWVQKMLEYIPAIREGNPVPIVHQMIQDQLTASKEAGDQTSTREDFITYMRKQNLKDSSKMSDDTMTNHMFVNLLAGSDTTAISLRTIFYHLMKAPHVYTKLQSQVNTADQAGLLSAIVAYAEVQEHIPYLANIIKESLRIHPAVALPLERIVPSGPYLVINHHHIPPGTNIGINAWVLHYDTAIFGEDASVFRPERWDIDVNRDETSEEERLKEMERSFFAFGHGSRSCVGKNISLMEMSKFVPQFLREFELTWDGEAGKTEWKVDSSWFAKQTGVLVKYKSRDVVRVKK